MSSARPSRRTGSPHSSSPLWRPGERRRRRKELPSSSSFARAARLWKSGHCSTSPLPGTSCSVSARCLVRQRIHVHASVLEALGFPGALQEGGPRLLGRFSSCVLASPEDYKKIGFLFSVHSLVRRWSGVQEMTSRKTFVFSTLVGPTADSRTASVNGGFQEVHTFSTCRWTLDPEVSELPDEYKKMCFSLGDEFWKMFLLSATGSTVLPVCVSLVPNFTFSTRRWTSRSPSSLRSSRQ